MVLWTCNRFVTSHVSVSQAKKKQLQSHFFFLAGHSHDCEFFHTFSHLPNSTPNGKKNYFFEFYSNSNFWQYLKTCCKDVACGMRVVPCWVMVSGSRSGCVRSYCVA